MNSRTMRVILLAFLLVCSTSLIGCVEEGGEENIIVDSDGDGVPDSQDRCSGHDDNDDDDADGVPNGCDDDE